MAWFPTFLSPLTAAIAAAIAVPSLLLLYFLKLRRREMPVASTFLWKKAIRDLQVNAPFQKLRRNLLLILQLIMLALLLLALSRPVTNYTPGAGRVSVFLIDRSASMSAKDSGANGSGQTRFEAAKKRALELVDSMPRNATAMVIAFDDSAETVQPFTTDAVALRNAINSIEQTDRPTKLSRAYQLAEAQTNFDPQQLRPNAQQPEVYVLSDGRVADAADLRIRGNVHYEQIGSEKAGNIAIVALNAKRNYERPNEVQVFARLANYGPAPVDADVELRVAPFDPEHGDAKDEFAVRSVASVRLMPERWTQDQRTVAEKDGAAPAKDSVEFTLDLTTAATIRLEQKHKDGDLLPADDIAQVFVPPPKALSVLLVTDGDYFLEKLMKALGLQKADVVTPETYEAKIPTDYDVIIFDRAYTPKKLPPAGNFIYFGSVAPGLKLKPVLDNGQTVMMTDSEVLDWDREHPILRSLSLNKVIAVEGIKLDVPLEGEVLVEGTHGPLIVMLRDGRSTHLVVAFDLLQSNWPTRPSFPTFILEALQYLASGAELGVSQSYKPGDVVRIPRVNLDQAKVKTDIQLTGPNGTRTLKIPEAGDFALPAMDRVGLYTLSPVVPQYERLAVNLLDSNESNLLPVTKPPGDIGEATQIAGRKTRLELWWWIVACLALPMVLVEWWVYTRRVHL